MSLARPIKVVLYAALIGLLLASYVTPVQQIFTYRASIQRLDADIQQTKADNLARERVVDELNTPEGVERVARERYGMVRPGEHVYIVEE